MRRTITAVAALAIALVCAAPAAASNIVYAGSDGNIWTSAPDGSVKKQVTTDGTPAQPYRGPTQTNAGRVLSYRSKFFFVHELNGTLKAAWEAPTAGSFYEQPLSAQVSPDGGLVAWHYLHSAHAYERPFHRVAFQTPDGGTPSPCTINCHSGYVNPRWIPGTPHAAMISTSGAEIRVQQQGSGDPVGWANTDGDFEGFDVSRTGNRILILATEDGSPPEGQHQVGLLQVFQGQGPPPSAASFVCQVVLGDETTRPRWSPDGASITWSDANGAWTSPAPTAGPGGTCNIAPKLLAAGARAPDWGPAAAPQKPADPDPGPGPGPDPDPDPGPGPGPGPDPGPGPGPGPGPEPDPGDRTPPQVTGLTLAKAKLAKALSKGHGVTFTTTEGGTAKLELLVSGKPANGLRIVVAKTVTVATGSRTVAGPGRYTVVAKFTKKAKAKLKKLRSLKLSARLTFTDAAGNADVATQTTTLKR
jgi:hypothetical protein